MPRTPKQCTVYQLMRIKIAEEMTKRTHCTITPDMVGYVRGHKQMNVYAAQYGDVTILCWVRLDGELIIKTVSW